MSSLHHYFLSIADLAHARGNDPDLSYDGAGPNDFAAALQEALRSPALFERWRAKQAEPDEVDPGLGVTDANANVTGKVADLKTDVEAGWYACKQFFDATPDCTGAQPCFG